MHPCILPRFTSWTISQCAALRQRSQGIKAGLLLDDSSYSQPSERLQSSIGHDFALFYDSRSKVLFAHWALKKLDWRISQYNCPKASAFASRPLYPRITSKQIQRVARHGGSGLHDLRGVRMSLCKFIVHFLPHFEPLSIQRPTDADLARAMGFGCSSQSR